MVAPPLPSTILLINSILGWRTSTSRSKIRSASSSRPRLASISTAAISASCAPDHALVTIARSSRRLGAKIPGVSMNTSCAAPSVAMPRNSARVVCTLCETMATLVPTSALISVDLPTLGAPINATQLQRGSSATDAVRLHAAAREHGGGGGLPGGALGAAEPFRRRQVRELDGDAELGIVIRPLALDLAIGR